MGRMPMRAAVSREMTVCSDPVSSTKSICGPRLTRALTMIFSLSTRNGTVCSLPADAGSMLHRRPRPERAQEAHFGARPRGFRAAVLVRQQVDVARIRVRRFFVPPHPLVDRPDRVVELGVARILVERGLRGRRAPRSACSARRGCAPGRAARARCRARSPARPGISAPHLRRARRPTARRRSSRAIRRCSESSAPAAGRRRTRGRNRPGAAPILTPPVSASRLMRGSSCPFDLLEGVERLDVAAVGKQQLRQLQLDVRGFGRDGRGDRERARRPPPQRRGKGTSLRTEYIAPLG